MSIESKKPSFAIDLNAPPPQEEKDDDSKTEPNFSDLIARELGFELVNKECVENHTKLEALLIVVEIAAREHEKSQKRKSEDEEERPKPPPHAPENEAAAGAKERPVRITRMPKRYSDESFAGLMKYPLMRRRKGDHDNVGPTKRSKKSG